MSYYVHHLDHPGNPAGPFPTVRAALAHVWDLAQHFESARDRCRIRDQHGRFA